MGGKMELNLYSGMPKRSDIYLVYVENNLKCILPLHLRKFMLGTKFRVTIKTKKCFEKCARIYLYTEECIICGKHVSMTCGRHFFGIS